MKLSLRSLLYLFLLWGVLAPLVVYAQDRSFVPLTSLPGLSEIEKSTGLSTFLNSLYRICIGAAATLAVFQIMHAGVKFMTNKGSITENQEARQLLQGAVFGLILVLSPVIVFGIINPQILELNFAVEKLAPTGPTTGAGTDTPGTGGGGTATPTTPKAFLTALTFPKDQEEQAKKALENCKVPAQHTDVIASYEKKGPTFGCYEIGTNCTPEISRYIITCFARSQQFYQYTTSTEIVPPESSYVWVPGESEKVAEFQAGCRADNGNPKKDTDFFIDDGCHSNSSIRKKLLDSGVPAKSLHCRQTEFICLNK